MHMHTVKHIACIGTGIMGAPIARHLLDAGFRVSVYNRIKSKAEALIQAGARWCDTVGDAVADADFVLTMLGLPSDVEEVYLSHNGILQSVKKGTWLCDCTTSSPELARDIAVAAAEQACFAFDCPVTGGEEGARSAQLTLLIGAQEKDVAQVLPVLKTFSSVQYFFGGAGKGQVAKLCNQLSLASCMVGYCDALALARESGLDPNYVFDMISHGMGASRALTELAPKSIDGDYKPGFKALHLRKDLKLALDQARELGLSLPGADGAYNLYDLLCDIGGKDLGTQALSLLYESEAAGVAAGLDWSGYEPDPVLASEADAAADAAPTAAPAPEKEASLAPTATTKSKATSLPAETSTTASTSSPLQNFSLAHAREKNLQDSWISASDDNA